MSHQNDEETRSRGRPVTPEADLRAALAEATLTLLLKGGYGAATVDAAVSYTHLISGELNNQVGMFRI